MLGAKIKKIREERNLSRDQISDLMDLGVQTYSKIETGERSPTVDEIYKLSKVLNVSPSDLLFSEPKIIFENCKQENFLNINNGNAYFDSLKEFKKVSTELVDIQKNQIKLMTDFFDFIKKKI